MLGLGDTQDMDRIEKQRDIIGIFERLDNFKIVLVHRPSPFYKSLMLKDNKVDLVLCGQNAANRGIQLLLGKEPLFEAVFQVREAHLAGNVPR